MRLYPAARSPLVATLARDAAVLLALILLVWLGFRVHDGVDRLAGLGRGVRDAGASVQQGFDTAAGALGGVPVIGGQLSQGLRGAGRDSGGSVAAAGASGEREVHRLANLLGWLTFGLPALLLLGQWLPPRVRQVRRLTAARRVLAGTLDPERQRLVAMRAAFELPYGVLLRHTRDPLGDLGAERYEPLVAAALEDAGMSARSVR